LTDAYGEGDLLRANPNHTETAWESGDEEASADEEDDADEGQAVELVDKFGNIQYRESRHKQGQDDLETLGAGLQRTSISETTTSGAET